MRAWVVHADVSTSSSLGASGCLKVFFPNTTRDMLSVTAGSIIFLCTELCLGPAVVCVSWGQREKEKERLQLGEAQCGKQALRRCRKNVFFFFFFFALRAMGTFWGHAHLWSSMSEMPGANVWGLCGVSQWEGKRRGEKEELHLRTLGTRRRLYKSEGLLHLADLSEHFLRWPLGINLWRQTGHWVRQPSAAGPPVTAMAVSTGLLWHLTGPWCDI